MSELEETLDERPKTRGDCENGLRPCPWYSCRHHIASDYVKDPDALEAFIAGLDDRHSCSLDLAEQGGMTLEEVGQILGVTRERVRQIEFSAKQRAKTMALSRQHGILAHVDEATIAACKQEEIERRTTRLLSKESKYTRKRERSVND